MPTCIVYFVCTNKQTNHFANIYKYGNQILKGE